MSIGQYWYRLSRLHLKLKGLRVLLKGLNHQAIGFGVKFLQLYTDYIFYTEHNFFRPLHSSTAGLSCSLAVTRLADQVTLHGFSTTEGLGVYSTTLIMRNHLNPVLIMNILH